MMMMMYISRYMMYSCIFVLYLRHFIHVQHFVTHEYREMSFCVTVKMMMKPVMLLSYRGTVLMALDFSHFILV